MPKKKREQLTIDDAWREEVRRSVRLFYDLQAFRIACRNRAASETAELTEIAKDAHERRAELLDQLESAELRHVKRLCESHPVWPWLQAQKGVGPTIGGVILAEVDIRRADTVSALWSFAGLNVSEGRAPRRTKGQRNPYNAFLRTKLVGVLADCMIKAKSPWREFYDNYKTRKENTRVGICSGCVGTGKAIKGEGKGQRCKNCQGTGGPAPWGESAGHRHRAALRYMIKMFLAELWEQWRRAESLPVPERYDAAYLGRQHGDHAGTGA